jgi:hypothetical protein
MNPHKNNIHEKEEEIQAANNGKTGKPSVNKKPESGTGFVFKLEKHPAKKGTCPNCGQSGKFRYYENLPREYGICDRSGTCKYHKDPYSESNDSKRELYTLIGAATTSPVVEKTTIYPKHEYLSAIMEIRNTNFHNFLISKGVPADHLVKWGVGGETSQFNDVRKTHTCFIYQNSQKALNVKKIVFDLNGKRKKELKPFYLATKDKNTKYDRCLYGEHLLSKEKTICLVESEKTAVMASHIYPKFDWLATGGASGLSDSQMEALFNRRVFYLCDADEAGRNSPSLKKLVGYKINYELVDLFPERNDGSDLADYIFEGLTPEIKPILKKTVERENGEFDFYTPIFEYDKETDKKRIKSVQINYTAWTDLLFSMGYRRFDLDTKEFTLVKIQKQIIAEVTIQQIQDEFINYIKSLPLKDNDLKKAIVEKFYKNIGHYFNLNRLSLLKHHENFTFNTDGKTESFIYFRNGYVLVNKDGWKLLDYSTLKGCIWKNQIIDRDFAKLELIEYTNEQLPVFGKFMLKISGEKSRFFALCSIIGYNLHNYFDTKLKATILTDSTISEEAEGRTGKTLLAKGLGHVRTYVEIPGKNFDVNDKYRFSKCNLDTQVVHLNDAKQYFNFETLYNDITEGITVDKKNKEPFTIRAKMLVSSNKTIKIDGASSRDRSIEFELAEHYNDRFQPKDEFGHWFFSDWDEQEWVSFDNFMVYCLFVYFNNGLVQPAEINLKKRKMVDETCQEFIEFIASKEIKFNVKYNRDEWHREFLDSYPDIREDKHRKTMKAFTKYLKVFATNSDKFKKLTKDDLTRSNNTNYVVFKGI